MISIVDYGVGNLGSVSNALTKLRIAHTISDHAAPLENAQAVIFPGVGAAGYAMQQLKKRGLDTVIRNAAKEGKPILAICLGMQLLLSRSEEGDVDCLGLIPGTVKKFTGTLKVPQMGWNQVTYRHSDPPAGGEESRGKSGSRTGSFASLRMTQALFHTIPDNSYFYFVHSYYCDPEDKTVIAGTTDYDGEFCSVLAKDNIYGVQFHPEKSGDVGLQLLKNFCDYASLRGISIPKQSRDSNGIATPPAGGSR